MKGPSAGHGHGARAFCGALWGGALWGVDCRAGDSTLASLGGGWLPDMDLNHDKQIQSLLCYRYTIGQSIGA